MKTEKRTLYSEHLVTRKLPINYIESHEVFFEKEFERRIPQSLLVKLNCVKVTKEGVIFKNFQLVRNSLTSERIAIEFGPKYRFRNLLRSSSEHYEKHALLSFDSWYYGYFHWMTECLPRFYVGLLSTKDANFFVPEIREHYHYESLEAIGIQVDRQIVLDQTFKLERLNLIERLAPSGNYNNQLMRDLSARIISNLQINQVEPYRKIYISRAKAKARKVINETELSPFLNAKGIEIVNLEDYSFYDQVKLMSETCILISIHGAGLTNMMFMQSNMKVLEIRKEGDKSNLCYFSFANTYQLDYYYLFGVPIDPTHSVQKADLNVPLSLFEEVVEQMF